MTENLKLNSPTALENEHLELVSITSSNLGRILAVRALREGVHPDHLLELSDDHLLRLIRREIEDVEGAFVPQFSAHDILVTDEGELRNLPVPQLPPMEREIEETNETFTIYRW